MSAVDDHCWQNFQHMLSILPVVLGVNRIGTLQSTWDTNRRVSCSVANSSKYTF